MVIGNTEHLIVLPVTGSLLKTRCELAGLSNFKHVRVKGIGKQNFLTTWQELENFDQVTELDHYYLVYPLLLLLGGKHFIQDKLENRGILGVLSFRMPPVRISKPYSDHLLRHKLPFFYF